MNKARILELTDFIEALPDHKFDMSVYEDCGTPCCIGGWAVWKYDRPLFNHLVASRGIFQEPAASVLGLDEEQAGGLFNGFGSKQQAVATLRHLAETGEVLWSMR